MADTTIITDAPDEHQSAAMTHHRRATSGPARVAMVVVLCLVAELTAEAVWPSLRISLPAHLAPVVVFVAWLTTERTDRGAERAAMLVSMLAVAVTLLLAAP